MGITHLSAAPQHEVALGHLHGVWTHLGEAAGSVGVGARRIELPSGGWSTPVHEHGRTEEIFYVLGGKGISLHNGQAVPIREGDCIVYPAAAGAHSLRSDGALDVLAFGPRLRDESVGFPRLGMSLLGRRAAKTESGWEAGAPVQFVREAELGPPELPAKAHDRPSTIVNLEDVEGERIQRHRVVRVRRNLGAAAGSRTTGLQHVILEAGKESAPPHCHSLEEELFVVLGGEGVLVLDDEELAVEPGAVVARPPGTGVSHCFRAGSGPLEYLAYGTREPGDICFYPRSNKIAFRGVRLIARLEGLDYWDGEDQDGL